MTLRYNAPDLLPVVCVTYVCRCGRSATRYGRSAGQLPPGWVEVAEPDADVSHLCARCASRREAANVKPASER